jgi:hypothetical protein
MAISVRRTGYLEAYDTLPASKPPRILEMLSSKEGQFDADLEAGWVTKWVRGVWKKRRPLRG